MSDAIDVEITFVGGIEAESSHESATDVLGFTFTFDRFCVGGVVMGVVGSGTEFSECADEQFTFVEVTGEAQASDGGESAAVYV
jgi:hypothetical protein